MAELINCIKGRGTFEDVRVIVGYGCDLSYKDEYGMTALHWCSRYNEAVVEETGIKIVRLLTDHGADINAKDIHSKTPIMSFVINHCSAPLISLLIDLGADLTLRNSIGYTVLHYYATIRVKSLDLCRRMIDAMPDINVTSRNGETPLINFIKYGCRKEYIELLLESGSNVAHRTGTGNTCLHFYPLWSYKLLHNDPNLEILKRLFGNGSLINELNDKRYSPLMSFVHYQLPIKPVRFLLVRGANIDCADAKGFTLLHLVFSHLHNEYSDVVQLLLEYGASLTSVNHENQTPLQRALRFGTIDYIHLFYSYGLNRVGQREILGNYMMANQRFTAMHRTIIQHMLLEREAALDFYITIDHPRDYFIDTSTYIEVVNEEVHKMKYFNLADGYTFFEFIRETFPRRYFRMLVNCSINVTVARIKFPEFMDILKTKLQIIKKRERSYEMLQQVTIISKPESGRQVSVDFRHQSNFMRHLIQFLPPSDINHLILASVKR